MRKSVGRRDADGGDCPRAGRCARPDPVRRAEPGTGAKNRRRRAGDDPQIAGGGGCFPDRRTECRNSVIGRRPCRHHRPRPDCVDRRCSNPSPGYFAASAAAGSSLMGTPLLVLDRVRKVYTQGRILRRPTFSLEADLVIDQPAVIGVVGPNRAGKTTLFEMMTGSNTPSAGHVYVAGPDIHRVEYFERDRLAMHYHQSSQVPRFQNLIPSTLLLHSPP